jgi:5-methylcytosine-specific restriction protein A
MEELQRVVKRHQRGERVVEPWRFANQKDVSVGDRVFALRQGKAGPAIFGYGSIAGARTRRGATPVEFDMILNPDSEVLVTREELSAIPEGSKYWRTQSSGILIPRFIAATLEDLVMRGPQPVRTHDAVANPDWTRDELIVALNFYLKYRPHPPSKGSDEIAELSHTLNRLGDKLFPPQERANTFRNENGVYMKLMNFRSLDLTYTGEGKVGLSRGAKADAEVWAEFAADPARCQLVAESIIAVLDDPEVGTPSSEPDVSEELLEAPEGRLLVRKHFARERNRKLVESKRKQVLRKNGKLSCEACDFDFAVVYGDRGDGFIECHHTKPVATLGEGQKTHIDDLALVCANCHRMIHRFKVWLSISELRQLLKRRMDRR